MDNFFDELASEAFDITLDIMGYPASWTPNVLGAIPLVCKVHKKVFTQREAENLEMDGFTFGHLNTVIEYMEPVWTGLYESVRKKGKEKVIVSNVVYEVQTVYRKVDGRTYYASLLQV